MKNIFYAVVSICLVIIAGSVAYDSFKDSFNKNNTPQKIAAPKQTLKVVTPTSVITSYQPLATPTINDSVVIGKEIKALYPEYAKYSDEFVGERYIAKYGNTPISQVKQNMQSTMMHCNTTYSGNSADTNCF